MEILETLVIYQFDFGQGFSTLHCPLVRIEKLKLLQNCLGLSKASDCLKLKLFIPKLTAYGSDSQSLIFIFSFSKRSHGTKINNAISILIESISTFCTLGYF